MYSEKINNTIDKLEKNLEEFEKVYKDFILELAARITAKRSH